MSSILYVINTKTQEQIDSVKFLNSLNLSEEGKSEMRTNVMQAINEYKPLFLCGFCKNPVSLSEDSHTEKEGQSSREIYFKHHSPSSGCKFCSDTKYSKSEIDRMKFYGLKEGYPHQMMKHEIAKALKEGGYDTEIENVVSLSTLYKHGMDNEQYNCLWNRPDITVKKDKMKFAVEILVDTSFYPVMIDRLNFYKESKQHVLLVLNRFDPKDVKSFLPNDFLSLTNRNVFEFGDEMMWESKQYGNLVLRCHIACPVLKDDKTLSYVWIDRKILFDNPKFDSEYFSGYWYDCRAVEKELLDPDNKETYTVSNDEETFYIPEEDYHVPQNSEEAFQFLLKEEIDFLDSRGYSDTIKVFNYLYNKNFYVANAFVDEIKTINDEFPELICDFLKQLIWVANDFPEYRETAYRILCNKDFYYDIREVFGADNCIFQTAWNISDTPFHLRSYLILLNRNDYFIPESFNERCRNNLIELKKSKRCKALPEDERIQIEKSMVTTLCYKLEELNLPEYFELLEKDKLFKYIIRLASYTLGIPLGCAHPNLAALTSTMNGSHGKFAHLTVEMIEACNLDKDSVLNHNFMRLKKTSQTDQDNSYDELAYTLFKVLNKKLVP